MQRGHEDGSGKVDMDDHCPKRPYKASAKFRSKLHTPGSDRPFFNVGLMADSVPAFSRSRNFPSTVNSLRLYSNDWMSDIEHLRAVTALADASIADTSFDAGCTTVAFSNEESKMRTPTMGISRDLHPGPRATL